MSSSLHDLLLKPSLLTLAVAESLTAGCVQTRLAAASGASACFLGGVTTYNLDQKVAHLGVNRAHARRVNCVSARVAEEMARGACALFGSDLALATTGYAEPLSEWEVEEPFAYWALAHRVTSRRWHVAGGKLVCAGMKRASVQACVADAVVGELIAYLETVRAGKNKKSS